MFLVGMSPDWWAPSRRSKMLFTFELPCMVRFASSQLFVLCANLSLSRYIEYFYTRQKPRPFPLNKYIDLKTFCICVLRRFSAQMLQAGIQGCRTGPSGKLCPRESAYQDEIYHCYWLEIQNGAGICSEWSGTNSGWIDFYIPGPKWGIEILCDRDRLNKHLDCFKANGAYHTWVQQGLLSEWVVLDCQDQPPCKGVYGSPGRQVAHARSLYLVVTSNYQ